MSRLQANLPDSGSMCGDDDAGHKFKSQYDRAVQQMEAGLLKMVEGLMAIGGGLETMAAVYEGSDLASVVGQSG